jgi:hypothetical protein
MKSIDPTNIPPELGFLSDCLVALSNHDYRAALGTTKAGLENVLGAEASVNTQQLVSLFYMIVCYLESKLKESYGEQWENLVIRRDIPEKEKEVSCSFCEKEQKEVQKIVAGTGVFICDECIGICNQILEGGTLPDLSGGRA